MSCQLILQVGTDRLRLERWGERGDAPTWQSESPWSREETLTKAVAALLAEAPAGRRPPRLTIRVERPLVQLRRLNTLPPVRREFLATLVEQQASTFFRKNGQPLVTDATWLPRNGSEPREALLAAVELDLVESLISAAAEAGLDIAQLTVAAEPAAFNMDLVPHSTRTARRTASAKSLLRLTGAVLLLWCLVGGLWAARIGIELRRTRRELAHLTPARQALLAGQKVRYRAESMLLTLDAENAGRTRLEERLITIGTSLPDSAFLTGLSLDTLAMGLLTGAARRATDVVAALERAHAGPTPRLDGAVTPDPSGGHWERFTIRLGTPAR